MAKQEVDKNNEPTSSKNVFIRIGSFYDQYKSSIQLIGGIISLCTALFWGFFSLYNSYIEERNINRQNAVNVAANSAKIAANEAEIARSNKEEVQTLQDCLLLIENLTDGDVSGFYVEWLLNKGKEEND